MISDDPPKRKEVLAYLAGALGVALLSSLPWWRLLSPLPQPWLQAAAFAIAAVAAWLGSVTAERCGMSAGPAILGIPFVGIFCGFWMLVAASAIAPIRASAVISFGGLILFSYCILPGLFLGGLLFLKMARRRAVDKH